MSIRDTVFCGLLADRTESRRLPLLLGLVTLSGEIVLICIASSLLLLAIGRFLQGLSGAVIYTVSQALLVDTVGKDDTGQAVGWIGWVMTAAVLISPLLGGAVYHGTRYLAVFTLVFGFIGADIILRLSMIEKKIAATWKVQRGEPSLTGNDHSQSKAGMFEKSAADVTKRHERCVRSV